MDILSGDPTIFRSDTEKRLQRRYYGSFASPVGADDRGYPTI
ncbi:hypothetical protein [Falsiroseomonas algicola]|nr:hypothetical protein [Falsiroseomonas algicola]